MKKRKRLTAKERQKRVSDGLRAAWARKKARRTKP